MIRVSGPSSRLALGVAVVAAYGLTARAGHRTPLLAGYGGVIAAGFVFLVPFAIGAVTVTVLPRRYRSSVPAALFAPWLPGLVLIALLALLQWEAWICLVIALPVLLPVSSLGGLTAWFVLRRLTGPPRQYAIGAVLLVPCLIGPLEDRLPIPVAVREVHSSVPVNADAAAVWAGVIRVAPISDAEWGVRWSNRFGLPRPLAADLPFDGVGAVRRGQFGGNLTFLETVQTWDEGQSFRFAIRPSGETRPVPPLDAVGGPLFDLQEGHYRIEPRPDGGVILHFTSRYRLATRVNLYGVPWADFLLHDIQDGILSVIKRRAEAAARP
ncbi:MAG: hypothetical protein U0531_02075 [Dehalococcoidia bacterium]